MNTKTFLFPIVLLIMALTILTACCGGKKNDSSSSDGKTTTVQSNKPLNISIYLDLSDRLERQMVPSQKDRDIEIVNYLTEIVKNHAVAQKILPSRDRIKVFFYPTPNDSKIALLSQDLEMDLSKAQPAEKKQMLLDFQERFNTSLTKIYEATMQAKNWIGSDIWGFFKKQVDTYCIREDARNIIVILTDGYLFYAQAKRRKQLQLYLLGNGVPRSRSCSGKRTSSSGDRPSSLTGSRPLRVDAGGAERVKSPPSIGGRHLPGRMLFAVQTNLLCTAI